MFDFIRGISIEGPLSLSSYRGSIQHEAMIFQGSTVAAAFGARLLTLLFERPEQVAAVLSKKDGLTENDDDGSNTASLVEKAVQRMDNNIDASSHKQPPHKPQPHRTPRKQRKQSRRTQQPQPVVSKGSVLFEGILQYLRLSTSPFRLELVRMLTSTIRHVSLVSCTTQGPSTSLLSSLLPVSGGPADHRWYFLDQLVQETIDTVGASVLDRYGTLPIMLQALLELSATIRDRYVKSV
jgi:hypothetical protein